MQNFSAKGDSVTLTMPANVSSGDVVEVGDIIGVALKDALNGEKNVIQLKGIHNLPKDTATTLTEGELVYWDGTKVVDVDGGGSNTLLGVAVAAAAMAATVATVRLNGSFA